MIAPSLGQEELVEMILEVTDRPERRVHARHPIRSSVRVRTASGTWFATSVDVSAGGILLEIESRLHPPLAERLQITLPIPGTGDELTLDARPVRLLAPAYGPPRAAHDGGGVPAPRRRVARPPRARARPAASGGRRGVVT
ncbi:MAG: PilZ domain-containing protein [Deltaproteobacteria bacterium]|nr:PilZ domain-containing protein [Deltaproteobacteria bacterium]